MSDDTTAENSRQSPLRPEQYEAPNQALEIFNSYLLENGDGPGTKQLLEDALGDEASVPRDDVLKLAGGLLAVGAALSAHWRFHGRSPQQIVDFIREMFAAPPPE